MKCKIAVLPGDGIGPEIMHQAIKVLDAIQIVFKHDFKFCYAAIGADAIAKSDHPLPRKTLETCLEADAVLLGAVGSPAFDQAAVRPEQGLLDLRKSLGLFANIRPVKAYHELYHLSALKVHKIRGVNIEIYRELSSGIYFGAQTRAQDSAQDICYYHTTEIERIAHQAFKAAARRKKKITLVDKANVLETSRLWREVVQRVHQDYKDIELNFMYVDNAVMQLIIEPSQFDVILTSNMFGDILSDGASVITGTLGMLPSASIGEQYSLFEPVHGSYPSAAQKDIANPIAMILSAAMLLEHLGLTTEAQLVTQLIDNIIGEGLGTIDMAPQIELGCSEFGNLMAALILDESKGNNWINKENIAQSIGVII